MAYIDPHDPRLDFAGMGNTDDMDFSEPVWRPAEFPDPLGAWSVGVADRAPRAPTRFASFTGFPTAVDLAVRARMRHAHTRYHDLLAHGRIAQRPART